LHRGLERCLAGLPKVVISRETRLRVHGRLAPVLDEIPDKIVRRATDHVVVDVNPSCGEERGHGQRLSHAGWRLAPEVAS